MSSRTKPAPAKPKGTPVKPLTPKIIGWTTSGGLMPIYYSKPNGPRAISKGGKKSKMRRSSRRRQNRQNRTQRRN